MSELEKLDWVEDPPLTRTRWTTAFFDGICRVLRLYNTCRIRWYECRLRLRKARLDHKYRMAQLRQPHQHRWQQWTERQCVLTAEDSKTVIKRWQKQICYCLKCGEWRSFDI